MRFPLTASALVGLVLALGANAQQPKPADKKPEKDPTDAAIAAALANDADVKMAQAKLQLAEAELAKARQAATLRVVALKSKIEQYKAELRSSERMYVILEAHMKRGTASAADLLPVQQKLEVAKAALAGAEAELKLLTTGPAEAQLPAKGPAWLEGAVPKHGSSRAMPSGPIPDRIRVALDKQVKLGEKGEKVKLDQALAVFKKEAGWDVSMRPTPSPMPEVVSEGEVMPIGAWFQLYQDTAGQHNPGFAFYVRDYGIFVANRESAPPDAPTLFEFWKLTPAKGSKGEEGPEK